MSHSRSHGNLQNIGVNGLLATVVERVLPEGWLHCSRTYMSGTDVKGHYPQLGPQLYCIILWVKHQIRQATHPMRISWICVPSSPCSCEAGCQSSFKTCGVSVDVNSIIHEWLVFSLILLHSAPPSSWRIRKLTSAPLHPCQPSLDPALSRHRVNTVGPVHMAFPRYVDSVKVICSVTPRSRSSG